MYTNMYEILDNEESVSSEVVVQHDSTNESLSNPIIFIDGNLDSCDELLYRSSSGCELMETEIGSSIDDNLLDENFMKSDSNFVQMGYFLTDSKQSEPYQIVTYLQSCYVFYDLHILVLDFP